MARVGLLGGTFNPPHNGHLALARAALDELALDRVELLPAHTPPHKTVDDPGAQHRVAMCLLAVQGEDRLRVNTFEAERPGPSYSVDTLRALNGRDDLTFIVGGDMARSLHDWREPEAILSLARLGVAERDDISREEIIAHLEGLALDRVDFFAMPRLDISSTEIRRGVATGESVRDRVPGSVADYIEREGLYR